MSGCRVPLSIPSTMTLAPPIRSLPKKTWGRTYLLRGVVVTQATQHRCLAKRSRQISVIPEL
jgi:hypothetical protein